METENYDAIYSFEKINWWYSAKRDLFYLILKGLNRKFNSSLDIGCGVGSNFNVLKKFSSNVQGIDYSSKALSYCRKKAYDGLQKMNAERLEFKDNSFDLVLCSDVLEHLDDRKAVSEIFRILKPGGIFLFSVPAHNYLWGPTDIISRHKKRYEKSELRNLVKKFKIIKLSYWNFLAFFPNLLFITLSSLFRKSKPKNTLELIPKSLNKLLCKLLEVENKLFLRFDLPQGVSIAGICQKK